MGFASQTRAPDIFDNNASECYNYTMAIFHVQHTPIGKTTHQPGTAGAHIMYICRGLNPIVISRHISTNKFEASRWFNEQEADDRKNARVCDKILLTLPVELSLEQQKALVEEFAYRMTLGHQVPWLASFQVDGDDAHNPHCHFVVRDRHIETGKRHINTSEKGSTERIRALWEQITNKALEQAGFEERIDRRPAVEQQMATTIDRIFPRGKSTFEGNVERLFKARDELVEFNRQLDILADLKRQYELYEKEVGVRSRDLEEQSAHVAGRNTDYHEAVEELEKHKTNRGNLKGVSIGIGKFRWISPKRKMALLAQERAQLRAAALENSRIALEDMKTLKSQAEVNRQQSEINYLERKASLYMASEHDIEQYHERSSLLGTEEELESARYVLQSTLRVAASQVTQVELVSARYGKLISEDTANEIEHIKRVVEEQEESDIIQFPRAVTRPQERREMER